ncbi:MAG: hypothetical protein A2020_05445 [Lentisphaerae bacterium GWF2_45_14]|nr:MAG: hypothetical protein A2020_05445 [Lentisphaerae bacterium GWF2_45_14]
MIKAAVIGISGYGGTIYNDLMRERGNGLLEIKAATVINQDQEKEKCDTLKSIGCSLYTDYREMLSNEKIDICFIPTGIHLHEPMTVDALKAGVNVVVEKPAAATIQEVESMKKASAESGKFVAVGYQTMYAPETELMKKTIVEGRLGKIKTIKCLAMWPRTFKYYSRNNWAGKIAVNGKWVLDSPFNNALAHQLNMICFLGGKTFRESAKITKLQAELYRANEIQSADTAAISFYSDTGTKFLFTVTHACDESFGPEITVIGEKGRIDWSNTFTRIVTEDGKDQVHSSVHEELRKNLLSKVLKRVSDPDQFICNLDIAGTQTLCVNGTHESSEVNLIDSRFWYEKTAPDGSAVRIVRDIESVIRASFEKEKLFSELGVEWAKPGLEMNMANYREFPCGNRLLDFLSMA